MSSFRFDRRPGQPRVRVPVRSSVLGELRWQLSLCLWQLAWWYAIARAARRALWARLLVRLSLSNCPHCGGGGREIEHRYTPKGELEMLGSQRCRCCSVWHYL